MQFEGVASSLYKLQKNPFNHDQLIEGVFVSPTRETLANVANATDDFGFGVQITYIKTTGETIEFDEAADLVAHHRERSIAEFLPAQGAPLAACPQVINVTIEPGPVFDAASSKAGFDAWAIVVRCFVRLERKRRS